MWNTCELNKEYEFNDIDNNDYDNDNNNNNDDNNDDNDNDTVPGGGARDWRQGEYFVKESREK